MPTKIEWCEESWNPVTGCTKISEGCKNCYAERMAKRLAGRFGYPKDNPFQVTLHPDRLNQPIKWKKPRYIFVCSMSDLFQPDVPKWFLDRVFDRICYDDILHHKFLILTKRPMRAYEYFESWFDSRLPDNVWFGVSVENQKTADERIPKLLQISAKIKFISIEPILGMVELRRAFGSEGPRQTYIEQLDWIIVGGESGPHARPMHPDWVRKVRDDCIQTRVPFFFKQWGEWVQSEEPQEVYSKKGGFKTLPAKECFIKVGKKRAGRLLDGREWNQYPKIN